MRGSIRYLLPFLGLCFVGPVFGTDTHNVKCAVNQERVWVYESLNSFDVEAKLKCGESVEILSRVKGFVKIRSYGPKRFSRFQPDDNGRHRADARVRSEKGPQRIRLGIPQEAG
jgi:hypothetical protein